MKRSREHIVTFTNGDPYDVAYYDHVYSKGGFFTWNWAAAIFGWAWAIYRGAYILLLFNLFLILFGLSLASFLGDVNEPFFYIPVVIGNAMFFGSCGTGLYFRWMEWKIKRGLMRCAPRILPVIGFLLLWVLMIGLMEEAETTLGSGNMSNGTK